MKVTPRDGEPVIAETTALRKARGGKVDKSFPGDMFGPALFGYADVMEVLRDGEDDLLAEVKAVTGGSDE